MVQIEKKLACNIKKAIKTYILLLSTCYLSASMQEEEYKGKSPSPLSDFSFPNVSFDRKTPTKLSIIIEKGKDKKAIEVTTAESLKLPCSPEKADLILDSIGNKIALYHYKLVHDALTNKSPES